MVLDPGLRRNRKFLRGLERAYEKRKSAAKAALAADPVIAMAFFFGLYFSRTLTVSQAARVVSRRLGINLIPISLDHPEISLDVDEPEDYAFVKHLLEE